MALADQTAASGSAFSRPAASGDIVYFNGINADTGQYAVPPQTVDELAKLARANPHIGAVKDLQGDTVRRGLPPDVEYPQLSRGGWGVIFHERALSDVRDALAPLITLRSEAAGARFKILDYKTGEQTRDWYRRHEINRGSVDLELVPYYLLIVGPPEDIPFEFQYLLGVDFAVGRLALATPPDYVLYAQSLKSHEAARTVQNRKQIAYWDTRHSGDPPTELSSSMLVTPPALGDPNLPGTLKKRLHPEYGFDCQLILGDDATKNNLLRMLTGASPPAILFTASHGVQFNSGDPRQEAAQGARPQHYLAGTDVPDEANVRGVVAFVFACFCAGTPMEDQFYAKPSQLGSTLPPLAPQSFRAALPKRLLTHPRGRRSPSWRMSIERGAARSARPR